MPQFFQDKNLDHLRIVQFMKKRLAYYIILLTIVLGMYLPEQNPSALLAYLLFSFFMAMSYEVANQQYKLVFALFALAWVGFSIPIIHLEMEAFEEVFLLIPIAYVLLFPGRYEVNLLTCLIAATYFIFPGGESLSNLFEDATELIIISFLSTIISDQYLKLQGQIKDLRYKSLHDTDTGLKNKEALLEQIRTLNAEGGEIKYVMLLISFDNLQFINNHFGFDHGFKLIKALIGRIETFALSTNTIFRVSEQEFILLMGHQENSLQDLGKHLLELFETMVDVDGYKHIVKPTIGVVVFSPVEEGDTLLRHASYALHDAHLSNNDGISFYTPQMSFAIESQFDLINELHSALKNQEFEAFFQPKYLVDTNQIVGAEALIRWRHPQIGLVPPGSFIPVCEETMLIHYIGELMLQRSCEIADLLLKRFGLRVCISVNVSAHQLLSIDYVDRVMEIITQFNVDPRCIQLEITEGTLIQNISQTVNKLQTLREFGISIAIDDFGIEYSSLSYLQQLPIDVLKLDRQFIKDIDSNDSTVAIASAIISLARKLGFVVLAEGVENQSQLGVLRALGCDQYQGFLASKPLPEEEFISLLETSLTGIFERSAATWRSYAPRRKRQLS